ncbi:hypothetical protein [Brevibacillus fulvus]|uniref:Uncharacterized protein n=1 Tax=Brevibacillus fulvus TaxID=1125967 RepID=A0A939BQW3_9BACL|nr:hypothetical protein [Brevibacillus fulvus]MBM7588828.1 hypothetical protein [Brevibacillus fulvus]
MALVEYHRRHILRILRQIRLKPYLPYWGELYCSLEQLRSIAKLNRTDLDIFAIYPVGTLLYSVHLDQFMAIVPELNIKIGMQLEECIDSLQQGRFSPFPRKPKQADDPGTIAFGKIRNR